MKILKNISSFKENFFKIDDKVVSKKTKFIYVLYIVVICLMLSNFLKNQISSIKPPFLVYPSQCTNLIENRKISLFDILEKRYSTEKIYINKTCFEILNKIEDFQHQEKDTISKIFKLESDVRQVSWQIEDLINLYPTILQEKMANVDINSSILDTNYQNAKASKTELNTRLSELKEQKQNLENQIMQNEAIKSINEQLKQSSNILEQNSKATFYYPLKLFFYSIFLIAIFAALSNIFKNRFLKSKNLVIAKLFYYNLNISALFLLYYCFKFINHILPKFFLNKLIDFLISYNLIFIFQYFAIFLTIFVFILIIKFLQNKRAKTLEIEDSLKIIKFISNDLCPKCYLKIDGDFCRFCGIQTYKICSNCEHKSGISDVFCSKCAQKF